MWSSVPSGPPDESQGWTREQHQWSDQQSNYCLSVPHESVDWAQLAKQWIQMQNQPQAQPRPPHNQMALMTGPMAHMSSMPSMHSMPHLRNPMPSHPRMPPMGGHYMQMGPNNGHRPQPPIIPEDTSRPVYQTPLEANNWVRNRPPLPPPRELHQPMHPMPPSLRPPMPPMSGMAPAMNPPMIQSSMPPNYQSPVGWRQMNPNPPSAQSHVFGQISDKTDKITPNQQITLDAAKKKNLPIWLREGLEKMEREKAKKIEKEKEEHERIERIKAIRDKEDELRREIEMEQKMSSKFDESDESQSEEEAYQKSDEEDNNLSEEELVKNLVEN